MGFYSKYSTFHDISFPYISLESYIIFNADIRLKIKQNNWMCRRK